MRTKIFCEEVEKKGFDELHIEEVMNMIGFVAPMKNGKEWEVTLCDDGSGFTVTDQATAHIIASLEEIKALLMKRPKTIIRPYVEVKT